VVQQQAIQKVEEVNIKTMNRDYPLAPTPDPVQKKPLVPVKRVYEIADSLRKESGLAGVGSPLSTLNKKSTAADSAKAYKAAFDKIDEAEKNKKESKRLKALADSAVAASKKKKK